MPLRRNTLIQRLAAGEVALGLWVEDRSPDGAIFYSEQDIDFLIYDMEHGPFDIESARVWLQFLLNRRLAHAGNPGPAPIARVPAYGFEHNFWMLKQVLDLGFLGVMMPHVSSPEDAAALVEGVRYPQPAGAPRGEPPGRRGARPIMAARYWGLAMDEYVRVADVWPLAPEGELFVIAQIESRPGLEQLDEILRVPGLGAVLIGPYDLSFGLGHPGEKGHPEVQSAILEVLQRCQAAGVVCGIAVPPEEIPARVAQGFRLLLTREERRVPARPPASG